MKKINNRGFSLVETLVVTIFISTVLIFLFIQFSNLNSSYEDSFKYNSVEALYALEDIKDYIKNDSDINERLATRLVTEKYIDIKDCMIFSDRNYCVELLDLENIDEIILAINADNYEFIFSDSNYSYGFEKFIKKINKSGNEPYRIIASFKNDTYATIRFGE